MKVQTFHSFLSFLGVGLKVRGKRSFVIKIISWNVQGLGSRKKRRVVKDFLHHETLDIVMLQETKGEICDKRFAGSLRIDKNKDCASLPTCGPLGEVLII